MSEIFQHLFLIFVTKNFFFQQKLFQLRCDTSWDVTPISPFRGDVEVWGVILTCPSGGGLVGVRVWGAWPWGSSVVCTAMARLRESNSSRGYRQRTGL